LGEFGEFTPGNEPGSELFAIERGAQQMPLEREMLPDWTEAREAEAFVNSAHLCRCSCAERKKTGIRRQMTCLLSCAIVTGEPKAINESVLATL